MKKAAFILTIVFLFGMLAGCASLHDDAQIIATTLPVYEFTSKLCDGTGLQVGQLVTENISCLHDYTLQVNQMSMIEGSEVVVISGGGLEEFLTQALESKDSVIDASTGIALCEGKHHSHQNNVHQHETDPHFWLSPAHAKTMVHNICSGLSAYYPTHKDTFAENENALILELDALQEYGDHVLTNLQCTSLITFHDGFSYFADAYNLDLLHSVEEESGSEASPAELIEMIELVQKTQLPAIFVEINGSNAAAKIISAETGSKVFALDMGMAGNSYFESMYRNIDTVKEALG